MKRNARAQKQEQREIHITASSLIILIVLVVHSSHITFIQYSEGNVQLAASRCIRPVCTNTTPLITLHLFVIERRLEGHCVPWTSVVRAAVAGDCGLHGDSLAGDSFRSVISPSRPPWHAYFQSQVGFTFWSNMTTGIVCMSKRCKESTAPLIEVWMGHDREVTTLKLRRRISGFVAP